MLFFVIAQAETSQRKQLMVVEILPIRLVEHGCEYVTVYLLFRKKSTIFSTWRKNDGE